ncbi:MAG: SURF1 family protein [Hyphomicrobium sp.]
MLARWRAAGLVVPTLLTLALLPVLVGLGAWQWQRKAWKEDLIAKIEQRRSAEPVSYADALDRAKTSGGAEYLRVRVTGIFDHAQERHVYAPRTIGPGWHVYTLFWPEHGTPLLFVNRGWVPENLKDPAKRSQGQIAGSTTVTGLARAAEVKGMFTPDNDLNGNRWYSRDLEGMRWGAEGPPSPERLAAMPPARYAPFALDAEAEPANPGGWPKGGVTEVRLSNSHLQYVVTWFGLALTLIGVFVAFARQRLAALDSSPKLT